MAPRRFAVLALAALAIACRPSPAPELRPNVVLVIIDTLRADHLGCYGFDAETSPELDRLAGEGVRFSRVVSQSSWTRASVASMLTSLHPRSTGIHQERAGVLADAFTTLPEALQAHGYRTIGATANPHLNRSFNFHQGFDVYGDTLAVWDWMEAPSRGVSTLHTPLPSARRMFEQVLAILDAETARERRAPHYLQFGVMEVHETWGRNDLVRDEFKGLFPEVKDVRQRRYLQGIRQVSSDIDWLVRQLRSRPGWEDTLFVFTSDHGEGLSSHPDDERAGSHGWTLYESQLMVPLILVGPAGLVPPGREIERRVRLLDLMPTVLELVDVPIPAEARGRSLVGVLRGESDVALPDRFVVETAFRDANVMGVYAPEWKYFQNRNEALGMPFHELQAFGRFANGVKTDQSAVHPEVVAGLAAFLEEWERDHPRVPTTRSPDELSDEEVAQLRSLGYLP